MTDRLAQSDTTPTTLRLLTNRALLTLGCALCILLFLGVARQFHIPAQPGFSASLLHQSGLVSLLIVGATFVVASVVSSVLVGSVHRDAGLFCAAVGLAALSWRGGPMQYVLFDASGRNVFLMLAAETIALGAMLALAWTVLDHWPVAWRRAEIEPSDDRDQKYLATLAHAVLMIGLMSLLARTDSKVQVLASVGISSWLAAWGAQWFTPVSPSPWLWSSPFIVALVGYLSCYFSPGGMEVGRTSGYFAALGRALPLDYASMGVAGALIGYWSGIDRSRRASDEQSESSS